MTYDYGVIGAGAAGLFVAHFLAQSDKKVAIFEQSSAFPSGASSAAGAFISPMMGKPNPIKEHCNTAFKFAIEFYKTHLPDAFSQSGIFKVNKTKKEQEENRNLEQFCEGVACEYREETEKFGVKNSQYGGYYFKEGGILDIEQTAQHLVQKCDLFCNTKVETIQKNGGYFEITDKKVANLILSTGIKTDLIDAPYIEIRPIWGERIEVESTKAPTVCINSEVSISAARGDRKSVAVGATHIRWQQEGSATQEGISYLLQNAQEIFELGEIMQIKPYFGARAGSTDYIPIIGKIVDAQKTLESFPYLKKGTKVASDRYNYKENLYIFNGLGARGFVYGPYFGKLLSEHLLEGKEIANSISTVRLFNRWVKRG